MATIGSAGGKHALVLEAGDHVRNFSVAVKIQAGGIKGGVAGRKDDGPDININDFFPVIKVDGPGGTEFFAGSAFTLDGVNAIQGIDDVFEGNGLTVKNKGCLAVGNAEVIIIRYGFRAFFGANAAGDAFVHIDVAGFLFDRHRKIADLPGNVDDFGTGEDFDV